MSFKRLRTLHELERHGFWLEVRCPACDRRATFDPRTLITALKPPHDIRIVAGRLRCYDPPGCGHRGAHVRPTDRIVSEKLSAAVPVATTDPVPPGVPPDAWAAAGWYERRRLIRLARNR